MRIVTTAILVLMFGGLAAYSYLGYNGRKLIERGSTFPTDYYVGNEADAPLTYAVIGDSTAVGTGASRLESSYPYLVASALAAGNGGRYVHVRNFAENGALTQQVVERQLANALAAGPALITVSAGSNDVTRFTGIPEYASSLTSFFETINSYGEVRVLFASTPDLALLPSVPFPVNSYLGNRAADQNQILRTAAGFSPQATIVDLYGTVKLSKAVNPDFYAADWFHPADAGYRLWADAFVAQIKP